MKAYPKEASIFVSAKDYQRRQQRLKEISNSNYKKPSEGGGGGGPKATKSGRPMTLKGGRSPGVKDFHQGNRFYISKINSVVKVAFVFNNSDSARHIIQHIDYLQERERGPLEKERHFFTKDKEVVDRNDVIKTMLENRGDKAAMFKIILSPGNNSLDREQMTREFMERFENENDWRLHWMAIEHENTGHHHIHILIAGQDKDGRSIRLDRIQLEQMRAIANEYQFELQYEHLSDRELVAKELGYFRDHIHILSQAQLDRETLRALGVIDPYLDKLAKELLNINPEFDKQLEKEFGLGQYYDFTKEFKEINQQIALQDLEIIRGLQRDHPNLFPALAQEKEQTIRTLGNLVYELATKPDKELQNQERENEIRSREVNEPAKIHEVQLLHSLSQREISDKEPVKENERETPFDLLYNSAGIDQLEPAIENEIDIAGKELWELHNEPSQEHEHYDDLVPELESVGYDDFPQIEFVEEREPEQVPVEGIAIQLEQERDDDLEGR